MATFVVQLRRMENSQPWGLRLKGGTDQGIQLQVEHVQPNGRAAQAGLMPGDFVIGIGNTPVYNMSHSQVKSEMLRAGNELDITIQRDPSRGAPVSQPQQSQPQAQAMAPARDEPRVVIDEGPICKLGGPTFKQVKPKTYQVLEGQLQDNVPEEEAVKPASIFDRKRQERSDYLKAKGSTISKAFGE